MSRPVTVRPPVTVMAMVPVVALVPVAARPVREIERPPTPAQPEVPAVPGVVAYAEAPGAAARIIIAVGNPRSIVPTRAVHDRRPVHVTSEVAGRVSHVDHVGRVVVDVNVLDRVDRRGRQDHAHLVGPRHGNLPGTFGLGRNVPDTVFDQVVQSVGIEHRGTRIGGVHHVGAIDLFEAGLAVVLNIDVGFAPLYRRGLRNLRIQYRLFGLLRAGHVHPGIGLFRLIGNPGEGLGQFRGIPELPGPFERG